MNNKLELTQRDIFKNLDGLIIEKSHFYPLKIYYEDTDSGSIVYHSNYLKYFERARSSLLNLLEINQLKIKKEEGIFLVARKATIDWHKPAQLNDIIIIETRLKYAKNSSITVEHEAYKYYESKKKFDLLVSGTVQIVAIDNNFRVKRIKLILKNNFFLANKCNWLINRGMKQ